MNEYISKNIAMSILKAKAKTCGYSDTASAAARAYDHASRMLNALPAADVRPAVRGEWILVNDGLDIGNGHHMECSECGTWNRGRGKTTFCPSCGALMGGPGNA